MDSADSFYALLVTGGPSSLYMDNFWGHDENLMYFVNHEYPLQEGSTSKGATCDDIVLHDGDEIDLAMFTDWSFWRRGAFAYFSPSVTSVRPGTRVEFETLKAGTQEISGDNVVSKPVAVTGLTTIIYDASWKELEEVTVDGNGKFSYTFDKEGTYYITGTASSAGTETADTAPAIATVTVTESADPSPDQKMIFEVQKESCKAGEEVAVNVYLKDCDTANVAGYSLVYDSDRMTLEQLEAADDFQGARTEVDKTAGKVARVLYKRPERTPEAGEDGRILVDTMTFKMLADGAADFTFTGISGDVDFDGRSVFVLENGKYLQVEPMITYLKTEVDPPQTLVGDVNRDGEVNVFDVAAIVDMINGRAEKDMEAADLDKSGEIDVFDVTAVVDLIRGQGATS